jgi:hypothetical protein
VGCFGVQTSAIVQYYSPVAVDVVVRSLDGMPMDACTLKVKRLSEVYTNAGNPLMARSTP